MIATHPHLRVIWYEAGQGPPVDPALRTSLVTRLLDAGIAVSVQRQGPLPTPPNAAAVNEIVLGSFGRAVPSELSTTVCDVAGLDPEAIMARVNEHVTSTTPPAGGKRWKPWFPVIDFKRCTNCMQCLSFCLFDVYGVTPDGRIQVQNEANCKTDCPACSRVCPEVAIMFPKYKAGPINGDEINPEDVRREAMKVDISALLGGDIYSMLRDRSARAKSRFSKERDDERALSERQRCLTKLKEAAGGFDVPPEVLYSLPSQEQIQAKAQEARLKAAQALARRTPAR
jgi:NAD-dependent dihydropyrimidine dehydrogenase PreA subunit